jgi:hypothetical protein
MDVLETCLPQHLGLRRGGLRRTATTSIVVAATGLLIGPKEQSTHQRQPTWNGKACLLRCQLMRSILETLMLDQYQQKNVDS